MTKGRRKLKRDHTVVNVNIKYIETCLYQHFDYDMFR